jgi:anti-sigma factor ChrR (cupin superfamily)
MTVESPRPEEHEEWSALYALGALTPAEAVLFEDHIRAGCKTCTARLPDFEAVATDLATAVSIEPPAGLRSTILARIRQKPVHDPAHAGVLLQKTGLLVSRSGEIPWTAVSLPGVKIKKLFVDRTRQYSTSLVSLRAGAVYPAHRHSDIEEFYLLEGDLSGEGIQMRPGDYCRSEPGTVHSDAKTEGGALLLVWSSHQDEFL